jgi:hypothetical protein
VQAQLNAWDIVGVPLHVFEHGHVNKLGRVASKSLD